MLTKTITTEVIIVEPLLPTSSFPSALTAEEKHAFGEYLAHTNLKLAASLSGQNQYLSKNDRLPLLILISKLTYDGMADALIKDASRRQAILGYLLLQEVPVCYVMGCPVYLSPKLTRSKVQVVGEIEWK